MINKLLLIGGKMDLTQRELGERAAGNGDDLVDERC